MTATGVKARGLADLLALPVGAALLVLGAVRVLLSVARSCQELACDDFGRFWYATTEWVQAGRSLYAPTPASYAVDGLFYSNLNLPHTHLLFMPFVALPRDLAAGAWFVVGLLAVAWTARMVAAETGWKPTAAWLLVFIWWMPTHVQAVTGQVAWVMLPLLAWAWRSARHGRWIRSGALVGVAVSLKPFLLPLVAWMAWRGRADAVGAAIASAAIVWLGGVIVFGAAAYDEWRYVASSVSWYPRSLNASLWGGAFRFFSDNPQFQPLAPLSEGLPWIVAFLTTVVVVFCWRGCRAVDDVDHQWSLVMGASLLISPLGWVYYGVWLLPGLRFRWPGVAATVVWLIPTPFLVAGQPSALATALWGSAATWGLLLAFVHIARSPGRVERPAARLEAAS